MLEYGPDTSVHLAQESLDCHPSSSRKNRKGLCDIQADSGVDKGGTILSYFVSETFGKLETMDPLPPWESEHSPSLDTLFSQAAKIRPTCHI